MSTEPKSPVGYEFRTRFDGKVTIGGRRYRGATLVFRTPCQDAPAELVGHVYWPPGRTHRWIAYPNGDAPLGYGDAASELDGIQAVREYVSRMDRRGLP